MSEYVFSDLGLRYTQGFATRVTDVDIHGRLERTQDTATVRPGQPMALELYARGVPIEFTISATRAPIQAGHLARMRRPFQQSFDPLAPIVIEPGGGGFPGGLQSFQAAVEVRIEPPNNAPAIEREFAEESIEGLARVIRLEAPASDLRGWWRIVVTPRGDYPVELTLTGDAPIARKPIATARVPKQLLDRVLALALDAIAPQAKVESDVIRVWASRELAALLGRDDLMASFALPSAVHSAPSLRNLAIDFVSGRTCLQHIERRLQRLADRAGSEEYESLVVKRHLLFNRPDDVCVRLQAWFSDAPIETYFDIDAATIDGDLGEIFLVFTPELNAVDPIALLSVDYTWVAEAYDALPWCSVPHDVDKQIEAAIRQFGGEICSYFRAAFGRFCGRDAVAIDARWTGVDISTRYFIDVPRPTRDNTRPDAADPFGSGGTSTGAGGTGSGSSSGTATTGTGTGTGGDDPLGEFPASFEVAGGAALTRLDQVQTLVVIMMENRSFDHLLGDLPRARPRVGDRYDGITDGSNARGAGHAGRVPMVRARDLGLDTQIPVGPSHHHAPVMVQCGDGTWDGRGSGQMDGFVIDLARITNAPQIAMTYYEEADLPVYYRLVDEHLVCDRWFCAHPGPTWPNRWITMCGITPMIDNPENDDPSLGYLTATTVFDTLTQYGIEWKVFESDLSLLRLMDRYRLDVTNLLPMSELGATLARPGPLPRVMVIEPNFVDVPGGLANDDHAPADLYDGQKFIADTLEKFRAAGRWDQVTFVITYDEHGGFYDHVPPPGSDRGDPAAARLAAPIHPQGPAMMGPRVPAFVVSPYVAAGAISHVVFDHTSILKTMLVHNRARLPRSAFAGWGARVERAAHLGQALTEDRPKATPSIPFAARRADGGDAPPDAVTWIAPEVDPGLLFDEREAAFVHKPTGWLVLPGTGVVVEPSTRTPVRPDDALAALGDRVRPPAPRPQHAVWRDPRFEGWRLDKLTGRMVEPITGVYADPGSGVLRDPATAAPIDPAAAGAVFGDQVRAEDAPALPRGFRRRHAPRVIAAPEPRDYHTTLRVLCRPRRRYQP